MGCHQHGHACIDGCPKGYQLALPQHFEADFDARQVQVRIDFGIAVTGEMLSTTKDARVEKAAHFCGPESRNELGVIAEGAVANDGVGFTRKNIEDRSINQVEADAREFPPHGKSHIARERRILARAQHRSRWEVSERLAKSHDPPAFVIDCDERRPGQLV